jgi:DNA repair protein RadC
MSETRPRRKAKATPARVGEAALFAIEPEAGPGDTPHYHGHRDRLRRRLLDTGADSLADYEVLEMLLFAAIPRRDVKPLAKALIGTFGSLAAVLAAAPLRLMREGGLSENAAAFLKTVHAAGLRLGREAVAKRAVLGSWATLTDYLRSAMAHEAAEQVRVLFLDRKNGLMRDEVQSRGTIDAAALYPREVVKRALELGAAALILVHNHPSGDPTPSLEDVAITKAVIAAAEPLGLVVHDHIIVGRDRTASLRGLGLI